MPRFDEKQPVFNERQAVFLFISYM
jgi:hypothetical protein